MKIALIGYGKMGKEIEKIALERKHEILFRFDKDNFNEFNIENLKKCDVAIEFTQPDSAKGNVQKCFEAQVPVVCGTTGWIKNISEFKQTFDAGSKTMFWASNFSIGVNLFFKLNKELAKLMNKTPDYEVSITEIHHTEKKDAPSGTAVTLAEGIIENSNTKKEWVSGNSKNNEILPIISERIAGVPGTHSIIYNSDVDFIEITHEAKSRKGFALGAVLAAEFIIGKKGFLGMEDMLK